VNFAELSGTQPPALTHVTLFRKTNTECICRICCSIHDPNHTKNIYNKANVNLLALAEMVFGDKLLNKDNLPRLLCRPCERKLVNFSKFKNMVKRCLNISPSAPTTEGKRARTNIGEKSASC
jgi:hypothetical protein